MQTGRVLGALSAVWLVSVGAACAQQRAGGPTDGTPQPSATAKVGQPAPDFSLLDCTGKKATLADYKDKLVVLQWVNQQCPWSLKAVPAIKELQQKYKDKGVAWVGIESTHFRTPEENAKYIKDKELGFTILMDQDGQVGRAYGAKTTPHVFLVNKGQLVYMGALHNDQQGDKKPDEVRNYLDEAIQAVLAGKDVPVAETTPWGCNVKYKSDGPTDEPKRPRENSEQKK